METARRAVGPQPTRAQPGADREKIGLIGVGLLGTAMAERLLGGGFDVVGFDLEPACIDRLRTLGGKAAGSATELAASCRRIFLSLPNSEIVQGVLDQVKARLRPGQILIDTTTGDPRLATESGRTLEPLGVAYLDAAICGNSEELRRGDVLVVAGGPAAAFDECQDLFSAFARRSWRMGDWGTGSKMKLTTNLVLGLNRAVLAEGLSFAGALGLDPALALTVLLASSSYSRVMDLKGGKMLARDFTPQARLSQHLKDVRLILEAGAEAGAKLPLSEQHRQLLEQAEAAGLGGLDNSAIIEVLRHM
ncbi:MAG: NAD(P)-dependent oxidoreductase [Planctomycetota bacterium]|nr:NAD(P)-dependent oxidoreductase [Planctomycetota bacterium]